MYKATMEAAPHIHTQIAASMTDSGVIVDSEHCDCHQAHRNQPQTASRMHRYLNLAQEYLPPSLGGLAPKIADPSTQSLTDMLRVLKFATETYLHWDSKMFIFYHSRFEVQRYPAFSTIFDIR